MYEALSYKCMRPYVCCANSDGASSRSSDTCFDFGDDDAVWLDESGGIDASSSELVRDAPEVAEASADVGAASAKCSAYVHARLEAAEQAHRDAGMRP